MNIRKPVTIIMLLLLSSVPARAARYNPFVWTTYKECAHIYCIAMSMQEVYFGTDAGILRFNRLQNQWAPPIGRGNGLPGSKAEIVALDKLFNKLWVLSDKALSIYIPSIAHWEIELPRTSLPLASIHSIGFSRDSVFIAGQGGIFAASRGGFSWHQRNGNPPQPIEWYGQNGQVSVKDYPFLTPYYATDAYFNKYPYTTAIIDSKDMWLGTNGYGAFHFNTFSWDGTHYFLGIAHNRVEAIYAEGSNFWIGGRSGTGKGFVQINFATGEGKRFRSEDIYGIISDDIISITGDRRNIWFGTTQGLLRYEKEKELWKAYTLSDGLPGNIVIALQLVGDTLFVGTDDGMARFLQSTSELVSVDGFDHRTINAFGIFKGELLVGTDRGAFVKKGTTFEPITDPDGDLGFGVSAIFADSNALWFGTFRKGIDVYLPDSLQWREFLPPTSISGEYVYAIAGNQEHVWVGTEFGVSRYSRITDSWHIFNEDDGLAHNEVYEIYVDNEYVWFGTRDGITRFHYGDPSVPP